MSTNSHIPKISAERLLELVQEAREKTGGKPVKYTSLREHEESILAMMAVDLPVRFVLRWLREECGVDITGNTLRKFMRVGIGQEIYKEYLSRNGWTRPSGPRRKKPSSETNRASASAPLLDLNNREKPATFNRTERTINRD